MQKILITGGAGFVGSSLAKLFKEKFPSSKIVTFDNLKRRGSELNLSDFKSLGIDFIHGDIRQRTDLEDLKQNFDLFIEASAEPSVHAGTGGESPYYLLDTNLVGTLNCLEFARKSAAAMIFLSTSRVYSIPALREIQFNETETRLQMNSSQKFPGVSEKGITENFPVIGHGFRSLYGSTKLASELFAEEYSANFNYPVVINRCGVIAGKGQFGKTDQGVFTLWVARHTYGGSLSYTGFGGRGKQVRDLLHPKDLFQLILMEQEKINQIQGKVYNSGGGLSGSVSLSEYTKICEKVSGNRIEISSKIETAAVDVPSYVTDYTKVEKELGWKPEISPEGIAGEIHGWLKEKESSLRYLFG